MHMPDDVIFTTSIE